MTAFDPAGEGVVKVIVATNTAESSITLPDVDHVICFGTCKQVLSVPYSFFSVFFSLFFCRGRAASRYHSHVYCRQNVKYSYIMEIEASPPFC